MALRIEHAKSLRHVFERGVQQDLLPTDCPFRAAIHRGGCQRDTENDERGGGDQKRKHDRGHQQAVGHQGGVSDQRYRAHGREVMRDDRERQQHRGSRAAAKAVRADSNGECEGSEQAAEDDGSSDDSRRPNDVGGKLQRHHAGVMHRRDADANDGAADRGARSRRSGQCDAETDRRDGDRKNQRQHGHADRVSGAVTGIVGQHGDKVGSPNSTAADGRIEPHPDQAGVPPRRAGALEEADCHRAGKQADRATEQHQTPIMLGRQAG